MTDPRAWSTLSRASLLSLFAAGWLHQQGGAPPLFAQASALAGVWLAVGALADPHPWRLCLAATLIAIARCPAPQPQAVGKRPVCFQARLLDARASPGRGWVARCDRLCDTAGRPRGDPIRTLLVRIEHPQRAPPSGQWLRISGVLRNEGQGPRVESAIAQIVPDKEPEPPGPLPRLRRWMRSRLDQHLESADAGLVQALLLGERHAVTEAHRRPYRWLGLLHLLAFSGLHLWLWDAWLRRICRGAWSWIRPVALCLTACLAGFGPAALRALCAVLLRDAMNHRGRDCPPLSLWAAAFWIEACLVAQRPIDFGLLLSYGATLGILLWHSPVSGAPRTQSTSGSHPLRLANLRLADFLRSGWASLRVSTGAALATAPVLHPMQGTLEPWSIPLSPILALWLPLRISLGLISFLPGMASPCSEALVLLRQLELGLLSLFETLPASPWCLTAVPVPRIGLLCLMALWLGRRRPARVRRRFLPWVSFCALGLLVGLWPVSRRPGLCLLPVGHGLAVAVCGERRSLLFDFGSQDLSPRHLVERKLLPGLVRRHWYLPQDLILSHPDKDHVNGLEALSHFTRTHAQSVEAGGSRFLSGFAPWQVRLIGCRYGADDGNNAGGQLLELRLADKRAILVGDSYGFALRESCRRLEPGPIDLLLAPHHGLTTDGFAEWLDHLRPHEVWISCDLDDLPLPALAMLQARSIRIRSSLEGELDWPGGISSPAAPSIRASKGVRVPDRDR